MIDLHLLHPHHLLYHVLGEPKIEGLHQLEESIGCPLCGLKTSQIVDWKITPTFSNLDLFAEKESLKKLCPACIFALNHLTQLHKPYFLIKDEGFKIIQFDDQKDKDIKLGELQIFSRFYLKEFLLNPPTDKPWILMLQSKTNPQHHLMKAMVNYGNSDSLIICDGGSNIIIPREGLENLFNALEKVKLSDSLYPFIYSDKSPHPNHKEFALWEEVAPIINPHKHKHYLAYLYNKIIPPKDYMLNLLKKS